MNRKINKFYLESSLFGLSHDKAKFNKARVELKKLLAEENNEAIQGLTATKVK